jgi:hypothetical protein
MTGNQHSKGQPSEDERELLKRLKQLRNERLSEIQRAGAGLWSGREAALPFTNDDLTLILHAMPADMAALREVPGIDEDRRERWGPLFLAAMHGEPLPEVPAAPDELLVEVDDAVTRLLGGLAESADPQRVVSPPLSELKDLRPPLNYGEARVLKYLVEQLPPAWEIYVQPHLNGLRPDFVVLHPRVGMAVFEVKDWNLDAMSCEADPRTGRPRLMVEQNGRRSPCGFEDPIAKIHLYKDEIHQLYCPRTDDRAGFALTSAALVFPLADTERLHALFDPFRAALDMNKYPRYYPLVGNDLLCQDDIAKVFPEARRSSSKYMTPETADDLRSWLVEPEFSAEQRRSLPLSRGQVRLVTTRTETGFRRIKGPAGSGKSLVVAARAAQLASEGKRVLVVSFNITLLSYLRDLSARWDPGIPPDPGGTIHWLNFHAWCKRACVASGAWWEYKRLWRDFFEESGDDGAAHGPELDGVLEDEMPVLVAGLLANPENKARLAYDAILVDEGQDFTLKWWKALRAAVVDGGEMVLAADATQNIYGRVQWTDEDMRGAGFDGPWLKLSASYRLPDEIISEASRFASLYLPPGQVDLPQPPPSQSDFLTRLRWVQVDSSHAHEVVTEEVLGLAPSGESGQVSMADITVLSANIETGAAVVQDLADKHIRCVCTFRPDGGEDRRLKMAFFKCNPRLKATTLHSFKGWESRSIVFYTGQRDDAESLALVYTGITRLKKSDAGSFLTVVCAIDRLSSYGRGWPDYEDKRNGAPSAIRDEVPF